mmetsp:Transcript_11320/g.36156  ORF Transcript_11320/g.36156 Transcript_11320/m.36156 type:complete len:179 (+) Transcript_11320:270-806(+)
MALTLSGNLYTWGRNDASQLGIGADLVDMFSLETFPRLVETLTPEALDGDRVVQIAAGNSHSACVTAKGKAFYWGNRMWNEPRELTVLQSHHIVRVACGKGFTVAITSDGKAYSWGKSMSGRLGRAPRQGEEGARQPGEITSLANVTLESVACGGAHSLAIVGHPPEPLDLPALERSE